MAGIVPNASAATYTYQAELDSIDLEVMAAAHNGYAVSSGCACTPANSGVTLGVAVASGTVFAGSATGVAVTGTTVTPGTAHSTLPRLDLITADGSGTLAVVAGTADATPEFPSIPSGRVVLAAVAIPAAATSITASNINDKRVLANYTPAFGTTSTTTARGDHLHAGVYASSLHADAHAGTGADPITELGPFQMAGDGTTPTAPTDDTHTRYYTRLTSWRPVLAQYSIDRECLIGSMVAGINSIWLVVPNSGTTLASAMNSYFAPSTIAGTSTPTASHPSASTSLGYRTRLSTAATAASDVAVSSTDLRWVRGDSVLPWCGYFFHARVAFPDSSYNNSGASTGSRFFCGLTDIAATGTTSALGADDPATNNRHGFQRVHVNGGKTQTNFFMTIKNSGSSESLTDTGIALTQNHVYDFFLFMRPNGDYCFGEVRDLTAGTTSLSFLDASDGTNAPSKTVFMRAMVGIKTINATARNIEVLRAGCEVAA